MYTANTDRHTTRDSRALIDRFSRHTVTTGNDPVPVGIYEAQYAHWLANHATRPYVDAGEDFEDYAPAYLYGVFSYHSNPERHFDASEAELSSGWESARGDSPLDWPKAKPAIREAWYEVRGLAERARLERADLLSTSPAAHTPGDH
jgi:hypothetical protein